MVGVCETRFARTHHLYEQTGSVIGIIHPEARLEVHMEWGKGVN